MNAVLSPGIARVVAAPCEKGDAGYCPPSTGSFIFKPLVHFSVGGVEFQITKLTLLLYLGIALVIAAFLYATRRPTLVPSRAQWMAEESYAFIRNGIARDVIGPDGVRFAPYLASLFFFILILNLYEIIPVAQIPVTSRISIPAALAVISLILFNYVGIRKQGAARYFKAMLFPPGVPKALYLLLTPIEFFSTIIVRPFTLAVRLFANMFAGHLLLVVFITATTYLLTVGNFSIVFSPVSFAMSILLTFFELLVDLLQAYIFTILTAVYVSGALAEEH